MQKKLSDSARVTQLVIAVLFLFTGIYFLDSGEDKGLLSFIAWMLFLAGLVNAIFNKVLTSEKTKLKLSIAVSNVVLAAIVWFVLWRDQSSILSAVWLIVGVFYGLIAGYMLVFDKNEDAKLSSKNDSNRS